MFQLFSPGEGVCSVPEDERLFEGHPAGERGVSAAFWLSTPLGSRWNMME